MLSNHFVSKIKSALPYSPNSGQEQLIHKLSTFITERRKNSLFLLKGYAGTGKTSLIGSLVKCIHSLQLPLVLMAPTGRAAKIFSSYANYPAYTIHKTIYRQSRVNDDNASFGIIPNRNKGVLFIVDEASLINTSNFEGSIFGTGNLLEDLITYIYSEDNCHLILIGDTAQLPPVGQTDSPALSAQLLCSYGLDIEEFTLREVARQAQKSGILYNATNLRQQIEENDRLDRMPMITTSLFSDLKSIDGNELPEIISDCYNRDGFNETIVITRSNKRANLFNQAIRNRVLYREEELSSGDLIMLTKNNYFWSKDYEEISFIANGETAEVLRVRSEQEIYGFRFSDITLHFSDLGIEVDGKIILDALHSDTPSLSKPEQEKLFLAVLEDYDDIPTKAAKYRKLKENQHFNAFQAKYAYATTCHKAQGGQWKNVIIDLSNIRIEYLGPDFYRWLYTSITRATERVYLLNLPDEMKSPSK